MKNLRDSQDFIKGLDRKAKELVISCNLTSEAMSSNHPTFLRDSDTRKNRRRDLLNNVNTLVEFRFKIPGLRQSLPLKALITFSIISWYTEEWLGFLIREQVLIESTRLSPYDQKVILLLLESKVTMQVFLLETQLWTTNQFFSHILSDIVKVKSTNYDRLTDELIKKTYFIKIKDLFQQNLIWEQPNARKPQRKRGYDDHGHLSEPHETHSFKPDDAGLLHQIFEERKASIESSLSQIRGYIGTGWS